jgi:septation ring formation regulator EzrA
LEGSEVVTKFYVYDNGKWFEIDDPDKDVEVYENEIEKKDQPVKEAVEQEKVSSGEIHYTTNRFDYTVNRPDQGYTIY